MSIDFKSFLLGYGMPKLPSGKAQFSLYVDAELKKRFDDICEKMGYKKQLHLERMLRSWIEAEEASTSVQSRWDESKTSGGGPLLKRVSGREESQVPEQKKKAKGHGG